MIEREGDRESCRLWRTGEGDLESRDRGVGDLVRER